MSLFTYLTLKDVNNNINEVLLKLRSVSFKDVTRRVFLIIEIFIKIIKEFKENISDLI